MLKVKEPAAVLGKGEIRRHLHVQRVGRRIGEKLDLTLALSSRHTQKAVPAVLLGVVIFVCQQGDNPQPHRLRSLDQRVLKVYRILAMSHPDPLLQHDGLFMKNIGEAGNGAGAVVIQVPKALRLHDTGVLISGELVELVFDPHFFLHFGKQHSSAQRRGEGRNQEAMIAACIGPGKRGGGVAADAVGHEPLAPRSIIPILKNITRNLCHK